MPSGTKQTSPPGTRATNCMLQWAALRYRRHLEANCAVRMRSFSEHAIYYNGYEENWLCPALAVILVS
jgi:hypothetical protein